MEFRRFVADIGLAPGLGGIGYMPIVRVEDLDGFVAEMRETIPAYSVFELDAEGGRIPVGERPEYVPVQWFEPSEAFDQPHGFDSMSQLDRLTALERARTTHEVAATPFVRLVSETESDGFLMYWPVIDPDTDAVVGFTVAPMDLSELLRGHHSATLSSLVDWEVSDITTGSSRGEAEGVWVGSLEVGGRRWEITVTPKPSSGMIPDPTGALLVLFVGLAASGLATGGIFLYRQRSHARQELEVLQELTRARDQFLASVSHELRTPLTGVLGFAELLREGHGVLSDEERLSMISSVAEEATDLSHIIDDLLVSARSELDLLVVTRVPVAARAQVAQVLEAAGSDTGARVEVIAGLEGADRASGDPGRVRQILRNLISNACRYGGDRIQVRLGATDQRVHIQVADNGPGIPAEEWERIFEPYYRAHPGESQPAALGIGLSVARHLARLMEGDLTYRRQDHWSVFDLELPAARTPEAERIPPQTAKVNSR
ncbi:MAG: CHASE domain-containing protein [Acidimicrobiia bacterium]|nr:CHASE domain-containing protein [Acidimicrobiia bacterium]